MINTSMDNIMYDRRKDDEIQVTLKKMDAAEPWLDRHWRHGAALVYFVICIFDFLIMPSVIAVRINDLQPTDLLVFEQMAPENQHEALMIYKNAKIKRWEPLTLQSKGLFHLSFGAILTGAVVMRGQERKTAWEQKGKRNGN